MAWFVMGSPAVVPRVMHSKTHSTGRILEASAVPARLSSASNLRTLLPWKPSRSPR